MIFQRINTLVHIFRTHTLSWENHTFDLPCRMCTSRANISWARTKTFSTSSPRALCFLSFCTTSPDSRPGPGLSPRPFCGSSHHLLSQTTNKHNTIRQQQWRSHRAHFGTSIAKITVHDAVNNVNRIHIYLCTWCTGKNRNVLLKFKVSLDTTLLPAYLETSRLQSLEEGTESARRKKDRELNSELSHQRPQHRETALMTQPSLNNTHTPVRVFKYTRTH